MEKYVNLISGIKRAGIRSLLALTALGSGGCETTGVGIGLEYRIPLTRPRTIHRRIYVTPRPYCPPRRQIIITPRPYCPPRRQIYRHHPNPIIRRPRRPDIARPRHHPRPRTPHRPRSPTRRLFPGRTRSPSRHRSSRR